MRIGTYADMAILLLGRTPCGVGSGHRAVCCVGRQVLAVVAEWGSGGIGLRAGYACGVGIAANICGAGGGRLKRGGVLRPRSGRRQGV